MNREEKFRNVEKLATGIDGFEHISMGGLPAGRTTLVTGPAGSAKTVFAAQFLAKGILRKEESGVFVTFEESAVDIRRNMFGFRWDIAEWEKADKWAFVDASPQAGQEQLVNGEYDFGALLSRIEYAVKRIGAKRVSIDSLGAVFAQFPDAAIIRGELLRITSALKVLGITTVLTAEQSGDGENVARFGVEEFVTDNVIILHNALEDEKRRRTVEILKFRGTTHGKGEFPFTIVPGEGIVIIPLSAMQLQQKSSAVRFSWGNEGLDRLCGGGFFRDSIILVSGATGCGKTLMVTEFMGCNTESAGRSLLFAFEESREQLSRNALSWGKNFVNLANDGKLKVVCEYPESMGLDDHLLRMKRTIEEFKPDRVAVDSLSALARISSAKNFRDFMVGLTSFMKHREISGLFTSNAASLRGDSSSTEMHISTITDSMILLRYVEMPGEVRRGLTVLKMRGSWHEKEVREFTIDGTGMHIGAIFQNVSGMLSTGMGMPQ